MNLSTRQTNILSIVENNQPITGTNIASILNLSKSTIRSDLTFLTKTNYLIAKPKVGYVVNNTPEMAKLDLSIFDTQVKDLKSQAVCVKEDISLHDAIIQIFLNDAGTVFVTNKDDYLCGVVSRKDFLKSILGNVNIHSVPVSVIMTRMPNIITTTDSEKISVAAEKIIEHKIDALPVVEVMGPNQYKITGRLSKTTISKLFVNLHHQNTNKNH